MLSSQGGKMMIKCTLFGHKDVDLSAIWSDGLDRRGNCSRCDAPMIQDFQTGRWRMFRRDDYDVRRGARPGYVGRPLPEEVRRQSRHDRGHAHPATSPNLATRSAKDGQTIRREPLLTDVERF